MAGEEVICVEVERSAYGLAVAEVQEVIGYQRPTRVFHAPPELAGITTLRGEVLPVVDLSRLVGTGADASALRPDSKIVVVREQSGSRRRAGLLVERLLGLRQIRADHRAEVPAAVASRLGALALHLVSEPPPFVVLSVGAIFDAEAFRGLAEAAG